MKGGVGGPHNRIFDSPIELHEELKKWDKKFCQKLRETGKKFDGTSRRSPYRGDLNKKSLKIKKWT